VSLVEGGVGGREVAVMTMSNRLNRRAVLGVILSPPARVPRPPHFGRTDSSPDFISESRLGLELL
jgi:hypothetical protein